MLASRRLAEPEPWVGARQRRGGRQGGFDEDLTDRARKVFDTAQEEARSLNHPELAAPLPKR